MKLIKNIKSLLGVNWGSALIQGHAMAEIPLIDNAFLIIKEDKIYDFGPMHLLPLDANNFSEIIDASDRFIMPAWCDSHTHIVFAGSREGEYVDKLNGLSYAEIAQKGGGILNSAKLLNETHEEVLLESASKRLEEIKNLGTCAVEIKSGYSMTLDGEMKMLRVIRDLKSKSNQIIKSTYLVHAFPYEYKDNRDAYVNQVINSFIPSIAGEGLADFIDVFCENGFFTENQSDKILEAGLKYSLKPKVHANQLFNSGGVQSAVKNNALSADHLEQIGEEEINLLKESTTIPTLLPSAAFFLGLPYPPARGLINKGLGFALATDFNPGSSPSGNMPLLLAMSCIQMKILPQEAITAATINGAAAMDIAHTVGSVDKGKIANLIMTQPIPNIAYFTYSFGSNLIERVFLKGV
jgi:imidazolonepropionase